VTAGEKLLAEARKHLLPQFGMRVSLMLDANGANTTAAAAVRAAARHLDLAGTPALVLGGTGPVGQRVALLLANQGAKVRVGSRQQARAEAVCAAIKARNRESGVEPSATGTAEQLAAALSGRTLVVAAGAAGAVLLPRSARSACPGLRAGIDLNAVPPAGIEGVEVTDKGAERESIVWYGAVGVGNMKIHKAAIARLFESNDQVLDAEEIYALAASF
jgi:NAD(P)-dependent dehydrogenase (short-subunit alcohol dehydrogenase family)